MNVVSWYHHEKLSERQHSISRLIMNWWNSPCDNLPVTVVRVCSQQMTLQQLVKFKTSQQHLSSYSTTSSLFNFKIYWRQVSIGSCNGLVPNRHQAVVWTNDEPAHCNVCITQSSKCEHHLFRKPFVFSVKTNHFRNKWSREFYIMYRQQNLQNWIWNTKQWRKHNTKIKLIYCLFYVQTLRLNRHCSVDHGHKYNIYICTKI